MTITIIIIIIIISINISVSISIIIKKISSDSSGNGGSFISNLDKCYS